MFNNIIFMYIYNNYFELLHNINNKIIDYYDFKLVYNDFNNNI